MVMLEWRPVLQEAAHADLAVGSVKDRFEQVPLELEPILQRFVCSGVDRSLDALKHANSAGSSLHGGNGGGGDYLGCTTSGDGGDGLVAVDAQVKLLADTILAGAA